MPDRSNDPAARTPARQTSIRAANLALVYRLILDAPTPVSRAALSAATGMTRATAGALADALLAANLLEEVSPPPATAAGRPATGLVAAPDGAAGLGAELNVDYLATSVVDLSGAVRHRVVRHADQRGRAPGDVLAELAELARAAAAAFPGPIAGTAVAVPGLVERGTGRIRRAPNLDWQDTETLPAFAAVLPDTPLGTAIGNEADFAALAELHLDRDRELTDFLHVSGEIGVGAGIVFDRALFAGARGWAGEIGHLTVEPDGAPCRCGATGCLETVAGLEALHRGDLTRAGAGLGRAIAAAVNLLDVDTVVLGGVYALDPYAKELAPLVERELATHVLTAAWSPLRLRVSRVGEAAAAVGAAASVVHRIHTDPARWMELTGAE